MKKIFLFGLLLVILFNFGCKKNESTPTQGTPPTGSITGKVTEAATGSGISAVSIRTNPATDTVLTNSQGEYSLVGLQVGSFTVIAAKSGYHANSTNVSVTAGKTSTADIQLTSAISHPPRDSHIGNSSK